MEFILSGFSFVIFGSVCFGSTAYKLLMGDLQAVAC